MCSSAVDEVQSKAALCVPIYRFHAVPRSLQGQREVTARGDDPRRPEATGEIVEAHRAAVLEERNQHEVE